MSPAFVQAGICAGEDLGTVKAVARDIRARFGDGVRLRAGTPAEWEQIEAGWRVVIPPKPFDGARK